MGDCRRRERTGGKADEGSLGAVYPGAGGRRSVFLQTVGWRAKEGCRQETPGTYLRWVSESGQALTVTAGTDQSLTTIAGQTAVQVMQNPYTPGKSIKSWLNPAAFAVPALGTASQMNYGNVYGPGVFQLNVALSRTFPLHEKQSLQFRADVFNLPNTPNPK
jgi:hypothetical protein